MDLYLVVGAKSIASGSCCILHDSPSFVSLISSQMFQEINGRRICPSCCLTCVSKPPAIAAPALTPYALGNLLPAGTVHLPITPDESSCDHHHSEDGWHAFRCLPMLQRLVAPEDDLLLRELDFLIAHSFISCTCRLSRLGNVLNVRVYLIPHDLANVQGRLRVRDEATILAPARRCLKVLLQRIVQDDTLWEGDDASSSKIPRLFLSHDVVRGSWLYELKKEC